MKIIKLVTKINSHQDLVAYMFQVKQQIAVKLYESMINYYSIKFHLIIDFMHNFCNIDKRLNLFFSLL